MAGVTSLLCGLLLLLIPSSVVPFTPDITFNIDEETEADSLVGNIPEDLNLEPSPGPDPALFSFIPQGLQYEDLFILYNTSGVLRTRDVIDRDVICTNEVTCSIQLVVKLQSQRNFQIFKIQVDVNDINDNSPVFPRDEINLTITEASPVDSRFTIPAAEDPDSPRYSPGIDGYTVEQIDEFFQVQQGAVPEDVQLVLLKTLDREETNLTEVVVTARDGGVPSRTGSIVIHIQILDVNDNNPRFTRQYYDVELYENVTRNTEVARVLATDPDTGPNGQVVYGFSSQTEAAWGNLFMIFGDTGAVVVVGELDYETSREHILTVTARDSNPDSVPARAKLNIHVLDINDNPPRFRMHTAPAEDGHMKVSEDAQLDDFFAHITVRDADSGRNGQFTCSLSDFHFKLERLYEMEYKIVIAAKFDYERESSYDVTMTCEDEGEIPQVGAFSFVVDVIDENDNPPVFSESTYVGSIMENNAADAFLLVLNATDLDSGENARISYSIVPSNDVFAVDSASGVITVVSRLDREYRDRYNFTVVAVDHGYIPMTATSTVIVNVGNDDSEIPRFAHSVFNFSVAENQEVGAFVGALSTQDYDVNRDTNYHIVLNVEAGFPFIVDDRTGDIRSAVKIDRETNENYEFNVTIANSANENQVSRASVNVRILDVNDNPPIIDFPSLENRTIRYVYRDWSSQPQTLTRILAHDVDGTSDGSLTYHIINSTCAIQINEQTGVVQINGSNLSPEQKTIEVWFEVRDNGEPPLSLLGSFNVTVIYTNTTTSRDYMIIMICIIVVSVVVVVILLIFIVRTFRRTRKVRKLKWMAAMIDPRHRPFQKSPDPHPNEPWVEPDYRQETKTPTGDISTIDRGDDSFPSVSQLPSVRNSVASTNSSLISRGGKPSAAAIASSSGSQGQQVNGYSNQGYDSCTSDNSERSREGRRKHHVIYGAKHTITKPAVYNPNPDQHEAIPIEQEESFSGHDSGRGSSVADSKLDTPIPGDDQWEPEYVIEECDEYPDPMYPILDLSEVCAAEMNPEMHRSCLRNSICGVEVDAPSWVPNRPIAQQLNVRFSLPDVQNGSMRSLDMSTMSSISTLSSYGGALI